MAERLPKLRAEWGLDFVVVNGENASGGMGLTGEHAKGLLAAGADCLTLGDHSFDQKEMLTFIEQEPRILRPLNYAKLAPGKGARLFTATQGRKVLVTQVLGLVLALGVVGSVMAKPAEPNEADLALIKVKAASVDSKNVITSVLNATDSETCTPAKVLAVVCALTAVKNCALVVIQLSDSTPVAAAIRCAMVSAA